MLTSTLFHNAFFHCVMENIRTLEAESPEFKLSFELCIHNASVSSFLSKFLLLYVVG